MYKNILLFIFIILNAVMIFADKSDIGTTSFNFLKLDIGARPAALGSAFTAIEGDVSSICYNPAGAASLRKKNLSLYYNNYFLDVNYQAALFNIPATKNTNFLVGVLYLDGGSNDKYLNSDIPAGNARYYDLALLTGFGKKTKYYNVGGVLKILNETIGDDGRTGYCGSVGFLFPVDFLNKLIEPADKKNKQFDDTNFGICLNNFGWATTFGSEKRDRLPYSVSLGFSTKYIKKHLVSFDYQIPSDNQNKLLFGYEYYIGKTFVLRGGYKFDTENSEKNFTAGIGINTRVLQDFKLDFSWAKDDVLGTKTGVNLTLFFGESKSSDTGAKKTGSVKKSEKKPAKKGIKSEPKN